MEAQIIHLLVNYWLNIKQVHFQTVGIGKKLYITNLPKGTSQFVKLRKGNLPTRKNQVGIDRSRVMTQ